MYKKCNILINMYSDEIDIFVSYVKLNRQSSIKIETKKKLISKINYIEELLEELLEKVVDCPYELKENLNTELTNLKNIINE